MRMFALLIVCFLDQTVIAKQPQVEDVEITPVVRTLAESRQKHLDTLRRYVDILATKYKDGTKPLQDLIAARIMLAKSQFEYAKNDEERLAARKLHLSAAQGLHKLQKVRFDMGTASAEEFVLAEASLAKAEVNYLEELARQKKTSGETKPKSID
ncbi:MAG: hypothetical protein AAGG48_11400 [Planctomycetota bacterium]